TRVVQVSGECCQILVTLVLQQFEESLLIGWQAIRLQSNQLGEKVWCAGETGIHVASIHGPLSFEIGKARFYFLLANANSTVDLFNLRIECTLNRGCNLVEVFEPDYV